MDIKKEAFLYQNLETKKVKCNLCARRCIIENGNKGVCGARVNENGKLFTISYSSICSVSVDPIEKKPLFHYEPGSSVLSVASPFCNFFCKFCQNWSISQSRRLIETKEMLPEELVIYAKKIGCHGISYTYTEPTTFFEWAYECSLLAKKNSLFNTFVTNGYLTEEAIDLIKPYLDAATVDFKGAGDPDFYKKFMHVPSVKPIYECLKNFKKNNIYIEITNLVIPKFGDSTDKFKNLTLWISEELGLETPLHILRFYPNYELIDIPPTPLTKINEFRKIAYEVGLKYVYSGNIRGSEGENTYCPSCKEILIRRDGFNILNWYLNENNFCKKCGEKIPIKGKFHGS